MVLSMPVGISGCKSQELANLCQQCGQVQFVGLLAAGASLHILAVVAASAEPRHLSATAWMSATPETLKMLPLSDTYQQVLVRLGSGPRVHNTQELSNAEWASSTSSCRGVFVFVMVWGEHAVQSTEGNAQELANSTQDPSKVQACGRVLGAEVTAHQIAFQNPRPQEPANNVWTPGTLHFLGELVACCVAFVSSKGLSTLGPTGLATAAQIFATLQRVGALAITFAASAAMLTIRDLKQHELRMAL